MFHNNRKVLDRCARVAMLIAMAAGLAACNAPLLSPDEPRSQFDRYDAVRSQRADQFIFNDYGQRRPNLQQRLSPRD